MKNGYCIPSVREQIAYLTAYADEEQPLHVEGFHCCQHVQIRRQGGLHPSGLQNILFRPCHDLHM